MSLKIYTNKQDIPIEKKYVHNIEPYIMECGIEDNKFNRFVISEIEKGKYKSKFQIYDRFEELLSAEFISATSKALIVTNAYPSFIFNYSEVGTNAGKALKLIKNGSVYIPRNILRVYEFGYDGVYGITPITEQELHSFFCTENIDN